MKRVVKFTNVSKRYSLFKKKSDQLLEMFTVKKPTKTFHAVSNVSFEVFEGEAIGIVGTNGSGKSTLSNLLAQVVPPTSGEVDIHGETTLVAISAGLNNHLTGYENIELKCLMHGLSKAEIEEVTPQIVDFADIGDFIDQPIKSYSSGMKARLGFAISVQIKPDILIIDEALSVGDSTFHQKCVDKFKEFKADGKTIFFISHSLAQVKSITDRIIWMNHGQLEMFDEKEKVAEEYTKFISWFNKLSNNEKKDYKQEKLQNQMGERDIHSGGLPSSKKKGRLSSFLQISFLVLILLLSGGLMFIEDPVEALKKEMNRIQANEKETVVSEGMDENSSNPSEEIISQEGYTVKEPVKLYADKEMEELLTKVSFATPVFVERRFDHKVEIVYQGETVYTEAAYVQEGLKVSPSTNYTIDAFAPAFPGTFASSYEYFFAFLGTDSSEIKDSLRGLTDEERDIYGWEVLTYQSESLGYKINEQGTSEILEVKDIQMNADIIQRFMNEASIVSKDEDLYYMENSKYGILLNVNNESLSFILKDD